MRRAAAPVTGRPNSDLGSKGMQAPAVLQRSAPCACWGKQARAPTARLRRAVARRAQRHTACAASLDRDQEQQSSRRRQLLLTGTGAAWMLSVSSGLSLGAASAEEGDADEAVAGPSSSEAESSRAAAGPAAAAAAATTGQQVYLDVKIDGRPAGRIVVQLFPDVPVGSARFSDLAVGKQGVAYRLSKFDGIFDTYVRNEGVKELSYAADGVSLVAGGDSTQQLEQEMEAGTARRHDAPGLVSLVVKEVAGSRPTKERLVAMGGRLVTVKEQAGEAPNGSAFAITTAAAPELDATNLVVGQVVAGQEVIEALRALPVNRPPDQLYNKPFFEVGKAIGDKRATVAEKGFNRPLKRALVTSAGALQ